MTNQIPRHFSAFRGQLVQFYNLKPGQVFLDLTLGDGGHTEEVLQAGCRVVSIDVDESAIKRASDFLSPHFKPQILTADNLPLDFHLDTNWLIIQTNFSEIGSIAQKLNLPLFDGIMIDLGPSQYQVLSPERGFSFLNDEPLDMRLDKSLGVTAKDLVNALNEGELANLFNLADETWAKPIAKAIVKARLVSPLSTTKQLADLIQRVKREPLGKVHPATKVFMALRMAVNLEREVIEMVFPQLINLLNSTGIAGIISFHSGEDKIVKNLIKEAEDKNLVTAINKKPYTPSLDELKISPRTRSAKLRLFRKHISK